MNLIANTGIQYYTVPLEINLDSSFKMYFHEWLDEEDSKLKLEIAHNFSEDDVWVKKRDLAELGYLTNSKVGRFEEEDRKFKTYKWEDIRDDFFSKSRQTITPMQISNGVTNCFPIKPNLCQWEKFENRWLPFPFFTLGSNEKSEFAPTNWCRAKLIPDAANNNFKKYNLLMAFDTRTKYEEESFEDEDLMETPVFTSSDENSKDFALCNNEFLLVDFCSKSRNCEWVDEYILDLYHHIKSTDDLKIKTKKMGYLAQYI